MDLPKEQPKYSCDECKWKTRRKRVLEMHKQSRHDGVVCPCDTCAYKATNRDSLARHKKRAHCPDLKEKLQKKPFRCKKCPECKTPPCGSCAKCLKCKKFGGSGKPRGPCLYQRECMQFENKEAIEKVRIKTEKLSEYKGGVSNEYEFKL